MSNVKLFEFDELTNQSTDTGIIFKFNCSCFFEITNSKVFTNNGVIDLNNNTQTELDQK